jgi:hypothetical protein
MAHERPWHVPVVGWAAVVVTALSAVDYLLTRFEAGAYLALFTEAQVAYFAGLPLWIDVLWPLAVWSGLAGALCLLGGARRAAFLLGIAALSMVLAALGFVFLTDPPMGAVTGPVGVWIMAGSAAVFVLFWLYARQMHAAGHLP